MAGVYGSIHSRADFLAALGEARRTTSELLRKSPQHPTLLSIQKQLDAVDGWTRGGRQPTRDERSSLDMALRAARELADTGDPALDAYNERIFSLSSYFEDWPSDDDARSAKDSDPVYARRPPARG